MRRLTGPMVLVAVLLAAAAFAGRFGPAAAQQEYPITPDAADCDVEPRSVDELLALWYGPDGSPIASPPAEEDPTEVTIPLGDPADDETIAAIEETVVAVFSCFETGEVLRAFALFSDDLSASFGPELGVGQEEARAFLEEGFGPEEEDSQILAVTDVVVLDDGRVAAFVVGQDGDEPATTAYVIFVEGDDGWLADEVIEFSTIDEEDGAEDAGTPAP